MHAHDLSLLVVDDEDVILELMQDLLLDDVKALYLASDGKEALEILKSHQIDVVITDIEMPRIDGLQLSESIREYDQHLPIIALSAYDYTHYLKEGYRSGINLYHTKPLYSIDKILEDCIKLKEVYQEINFNKKEIKRLHEENEKLLVETVKDFMTGLYNRKGIVENFQARLKSSIRSSIPFAIVLADIDNFKKINDIYGHNVGDKVICDISNVFKKEIRENDLVGRWGGEEFVIALEFSKQEDITNLLERIRQIIDEKIYVKETNITVSFGYTIFTPPKVSPIDLDCKSLIHDADKALYRAKEQGKNCIVFYGDSEAYH